MGPCRAALAFTGERGVAQHSTGKSVAVKDVAHSFEAEWNANPPSHPNSQPPPPPPPPPSLQFSELEMFVD
ncbi:GL25758 [Drosophila persimilis]|uniref:GL25758 n=1 Tax=Drosophila persimilis TaxID=7234 RepID=B4GK22_DROPE|nr:GL25758 [Drosophila persimilis]